ncbi:MAG TPA: PAS domain-containing sensor histidine kinase [Anaerolineae bacterium]|nr:PAS domain-containing sensor histidine kinase [Anaerolineae bacterium]HMR62707.1 PAS domain-containing sensor histidine kinase [Anaerolineae bacterium]
MMMLAPVLFTEFAPAERAPAAVIEHEVQSFSTLSPIHECLNAIPDVFLILNEYRQIVYANQAMLKLIGQNEATQVYGLRPGEVLDCIHATTSPGGCGTTEFCRTCGAVKAILSSLRGKEAIQECRITQNSGDSLDLRVWATPMQRDGKIYSLFAVKDISHEKRRLVLERLFLHDLMNTAGGIQGVSELLQDASPEELDELKRMVYVLADRLVGEIQSQRILVAAENFELEAQPVLVKSLRFLCEMANFYRSHEVADERYIVVDPASQDLDFCSDRALLGRVVGNLLKNALEASNSGDTVTLGCRRGPRKTVEIWVHNPTSIPRNVQLQIFQRSFSTKGADRGLGTYSIRLLTERYLNGKVWFTTSPEEGTTFTCQYPLA